MGKLTRVVRDAFLKITSKHNEPHTCQKDKNMLSMQSLSAFKPREG